MNLDKNLLTQLHHTKIPLFFTIFFAVLTAVAIILQAGILSETINGVFLENQTLGDVKHLIVFFTIISFLRALFHWLEQTSAGGIANRIKSNLRKKLANKLIKLGPIQTRSEETGELSNTITAGIDALDDYFSQYIPQLFKAVLIPLIILGFVFPLDLLSGLVFLLTAPLIPLFMVLIGSIADALTKKQWKIMSRMSAFFLDVLQGISTLKILGRSTEYADKILEISEEFRRVTMKVLRVAFLSALVLELVATLSIAVIAVEIGLRLLYAKIEFREALFILILAPEFYQTLRQLGTRFHAGMEGVAAAERIFAVLKTPIRISESQHTSKLDLSTDLITFKNVGYRYPASESPALKNISMLIEPGRRTAMVGARGAGKSTITYLLLRFMAPDSGEIFVNDRSLNSIAPDFWRDQISWISQNPFLFHRSIKDNLQIAKASATEQEIIDAARKAIIHDTISVLPLGYDTMVGEKGIRFSAGEMQRIALARAFLKDAPFVILDEPTANLDPLVEQKIQSAMQTHLNNRTVLTIAHRLNTIKNADTIFVVSNGTIVEQGSHENLLHAGSEYSQMLSDHGDAG